MERFSYEDGCGILILRQLKEVLALAMNKHFQSSNNIYNVAYNICTTNLSKNEAILSFTIILYMLLRGP